jgi:hypothetical protein
VLGIVAQASGVLTRQAVVEALQALGHDLGDTSGVSHILRGLEDADLVLRWSEGRTTMVEVTPEGLAIASERGLLPATKTPADSESELLDPTTARHKLPDDLSTTSFASNGLVLVHRQNCKKFVRVEIPHQNPSSSRNLRTKSSSRIAALSGSRS